MYALFLCVLSHYYEFTDALKQCYDRLFYQAKFDEKRSFDVRLCPDQGKLQYVFDAPSLRYVHISDTMTVVQRSPYTTIDTPIACKPYFIYVSYNNKVQIKLPSNIMLEDNDILSYLFVRHYMNINHKAMVFDENYVLSCVDFQYHTFTLDRNSYVRLYSTSYNVHEEGGEFTD